MKIELRKSTWYWNLAAFVVFIITIGIVMHVVQQYKNISNLYESVAGSYQIPSSVGEVNISVGSTATLSGLHILFNGVTSDSRCPVDVQCIQAGNVTVSTTLTSGAKVEQKTFSLNQKPYKFGGYNISLIRVVPEKNSKTTVDPSDYVAAFKVTKAS